LLGGSSSRVLGARAALVGRIELHVVLDFKERGDGGASAETHAAR